VRRRPAEPDALTVQRVWLAHLRGEPERPEPPLSEPQWALLANEAARHHLPGLTYRALADGRSAGAIPVPVRERLRRAYVAGAVRNALLFRETAQTAAALRSAGIPVMLLKGLHLARFVYPEPALRTMADADLMVPRDQLARAEQVLLDRGYGPVPRPEIEPFCTWSNHLAKLEKAGAADVELHWTIERPTSPFRIDLEGLWARSREVGFEGVPVRVLTPEDLLLHLALHLSYHHRFDRSALKGLADVQAVVRKYAGAGGLDWDTVANRANAWGASGFVYTTLCLAERILGAPIPAPVLRSLWHEAQDESMVALAERYILEPAVALPRPYLELARSRRPGERWRMILEHVFLPREKMERLHGLRPGSALVYPYYAGRLLRLLARRSGLLLRSLLRIGPLPRALDREAARIEIESWTQQATGPAAS